MTPESAPPALPRGKPLPAWIPFGRLGRPHGVRGEVRLEPFARDDELPEEVESLRLIGPSGVARVMRLASVRPVHEAYLVSFEGFASRETVGELRQHRVEIARADLPPAPPGEHYSFELVGTVVLSEAGELIGEVSDVMDNGGQELLRLQTASGERLFALAPQTFVRLDRDERRLIVRDAAGVLAADLDGRPDDGDREADETES